MSDPATAPRAFLEQLFATAVAVADPMRVVAKHLPPRPDGRLIVIGAGKASARMAEAVEAHYGPCAGLVITRYGYARPCAGIEIVEAAHPVPDQAGVAATARMLDLLGGLGADDTVIALISGGGSALLCAPGAGLTLSDKVALNGALLASGAPISDMNIVRKFASRVKGGKLAAACHPARVISLLISDVPGDDPAFIASGPSVGDAHVAADAIAILDRFVPDAGADLRAAIASGTVIAPDDRRLERAETHIIAAPSASLAAAAAQAGRAGVRAEILGDALEGEARELGRSHAAMALQRQGEMAADDPPLLLLSGGECTVTRCGAGVGGPNAEYVLAAALALKGAAGIHVLACDTDGVDGAAEIAGAFAAPDSLARGPGAQTALAENDAHTYFTALGDSIVTGPTLTNVNDFRAILIRPNSS